MFDRPATSPGPCDPPPWLDRTTLCALHRVARQALARGLGPAAAAESVRDRLIGWRPSLPLTMAEEAASFVLGRMDGIPPAATRSPTVEAEIAALADALTDAPRRRRPGRATCAADHADRSANWPRRADSHAFRHAWHDDPPGRVDSRYMAKLILTTRLFAPTPRIRP